ncbi:MAG: 30S ribosome-binding factor RbfA [Actinobacteria bacterium]|nr:30S ribosome-binding factor RbfA [Actinomycetota bacterium]
MAAGRARGGPGRCERGAPPGAGRRGRAVRPRCARPRGLCAGARAARRRGGPRAVTATRGSGRQYPRTARINEVVREALADALERTSDPRLAMVTITGVDVTRDLRHAKVYYAAMGRHDDDLAAALRSATPFLRSALGRQVRMKWLPELEFVLDPAIEQGQRVEEILRTIRDGDAPEDSGS